jgi:SAM-dependent methyltransferase
MQTGPFFGSIHSPRARGGSHTRSLAVTLVLAGVVSLILYGHGVSWWYTPLAAGVVLAHVAILGGIAFIATRAIRKPHAHGPATEDPGSGLLHNPRLFDWLVPVITLGREKKLRRWMLDQAGLKTGDVVLDVGSGTGSLLLEAAERVGPTGALHGVEPSPEMVARARQKARRRQVPMLVLESSAESLPYSTASFDAVFCTLVLHHLPEPRREVAIREMRRVLQPGGRIVLVDWQRRKSLGVTGVLSLVSLLHHVRPGASPNTLDIEPLMRELGFEAISRQEFKGGALAAVVGRVGNGTQD